MKNALYFKQKQSLNISLKLWLPLLQASLQELDNMFEKYSYENPFLRSNAKSSGGFQDQKQSFIENTLYSEESLYDMLLEKITAPLFPTPNSQKIAHEILLDIDDRGFFDGDIEDIANRCGVYKEFVETIRLRFAYLEPAGVGAINFVEACEFQLMQLELDDELNALVGKMIQNLKSLDKYHKHHRFDEAMRVIKHFNFAPLLEYMEDTPEIIPDFFVEVGDDIKIRINSEHYPDVIINDPFSSKNDELKHKLKEARDLVNLLELRKSTLYKLVLIIVEKQIGFFVGSELKPLTMKVLSDELGFEESTISRAVSNKYISCSRGTFPLKHFFTNAISKNLSSSEIKNFLKQLIENELHDSPLSDDELLEKIETRFRVKMVRRTITKYRKLLEIPSSKERKKLYKVSETWKA
ncbi:MAG: RNA polymerase factor sigma-54 [Sulfurovum sp.]|nr:MAG: RNA polymerase factor sigma-54 [Sulfurovum sp.]